MHAPKDKDNRGARRLRALFPHYGGAMEVARASGAAHAAVCRWFTAETTPRTPMRFKLEELYDIDPRAWDESLAPPKLVYPDEESGPGDSSRHSEGAA